MVTGASKGLGRAIALALARQGSPVALVARGSSALKAVEQEITASGGAARCFLADVSSEADVERLEREVSGAMGKVSIVVNNAGIALRRRITEFTLEEWNRVQRSNLTSAFLMSRAFIPHMKGTGYGRIINVASIMAHISIGERAAYSSTKSALLGLTRATALELAKDGITANTISPGWFATAMTEVLQKDPEVNNSILERVPMGRWGRPEEIGSLAAWMCTDLAGFMTGTDVAMDGGWLAQ